MSEGKEGYQPSSEEIAKAEAMMTDEQKEQSKIREQFRKEIKGDYEEYGLRKLAEGEEDAERKITELLRIFPQILNEEDARTPHYGGFYETDATVKGFGTGIFGVERSEARDEEERKRFDETVGKIQRDLREKGIDNIYFPCYQAGRNKSITYGEVIEDIFQPEIIIEGVGHELVYEGTPQTVRGLSRRLEYRNPEIRAFFDRMYEKAQIRANIIAYRKIEKFLQGKGAL